MKKESGFVLVFIILLVSVICIFMVYAINNPYCGLYNVVANSSNGQGGVSICGVDYLCGAVDGVCPEDFGANCTFCVDVDCVGNVSGFVYDFTGNPLGARVTITSFPSPPNLTSISTMADETTGAFNFAVPSGNYYFSATKEGYDTEIKEVLILRSKNTSIIFNLPNGSCHPDCTNYFGRCNKDCDGLSFSNASTDRNCTFYDSHAADICDNRKKDVTMYYGPSSEPEWDNYIDCCEGIPYLKYTGTVSFEGNISDLIKQTKLVKFDENIVKLVIAVWNK